MLMFLESFPEDRPMAKTQLGILSVLGLFFKRQDEFYTASPFTCIRGVINSLHICVIVVALDTAVERAIKEHRNLR
jgi:hypothetical protein